MTTNHSQKKLLFPVNGSFDVNFPYIREPKEVGCFSLDGNRKYHHDSRQLKYMVWPKELDKVHFDLNVGYKDAIRKDFNNSQTEKLDNLLHWIIDNQKVFSVHGTDINELKSLSTDFVCYRGLMTTLLCTPFEKKEGWIICATKYRGTIYLCQFDTEEKKSREKNMSEREKLMSFWGYKFEQYLTTSDQGHPPDAHSVLNENEEFCSVVRSRLTEHSLVYGAEMDCTEQKNSTPARHYIELKTSRQITNSKQNNNFQRFKLLKWWAQSFLIGIPIIVCGFRNDYGIVQSLEIFKTMEIPQIAKGMWKGNVCLNFCNQLLTHIKKCVEKDDPRVVYKFVYDPVSDITCEELKSGSAFEFLPSWYIEQLFANGKSWKFHTGYMNQFSTKNISIKDVITVYNGF